MVTVDSDFNTIDADLEAFRRHLRVKVRRTLRETIGPGVGGPAFHIVEALVARGPLSPSDLASALEVRTSTMATQLNRLEELGWVRREAAAPGTNRVLVSVTAAGRAAFARYVELRRVALADVLRPLAPEQVTALAQVLHAWVNAQGDPK